MSIARFEPVIVNRLVRGVDANGEATVQSTPYRNLRARIRDVKNNLELQEQYRLYTSFTNLTLNYSPLTRELIDNQDGFSFTWRNQDWRYTDAIESNDRMNVTFVVYRAEPGVKV